MQEIPLLKSVDTLCIKKKVPPALPLASQRQNTHMQKKKAEGMTDITESAPRFPAGLNEQAQTHRLPLRTEPVPTLASTSWNAVQWEPLLRHFISADKSTRAE